jgi:riboflavin transporter FmnP
MQLKQKIANYFTTRNIAIMAILSAISFILYMFAKFPLPFMFPGFLDMQFSDLPALLGGFAIGPFAGGIIIVIKCLLKMPFSGTACVGELADIIVGLAFVLPAAFFYKYNRSKKGAILSMVIGTAIAIGVSLLANRFILIPFFANEYGMGAVVGMMQSLYPSITPDNIYDYYIPLAALPFNALRCIVCSVITYFVYKPVSRAMRWERKKAKQIDDTTDNTQKD